MSEKHPKQWCGLMHVASGSSCMYEKPTRPQSSLSTTMVFTLAPSTVKWPRNAVLGADPARRAQGRLCHPKPTGRHRRVPPGFWEVLWGFRGAFLNFLRRGATTRGRAQNRSSPIFALVRTRARTGRSSGINPPRPPAPRPPLLHIYPAKCLEGLFGPRQ